MVIWAIGHRPLGSGQLPPEYLQSTSRLTPETFQSSLNAPEPAEAAVFVRTRIVNSSLSFRQAVGKWCRSEGTFYGTKSHQCGPPQEGNSYSYIIVSEVDDEGGFTFVTKGSALWSKVSRETGWDSKDFVWVPADTSLRPRVPLKRKQPAKQTRTYHLL